MFSTQRPFCGSDSGTLNPMQSKARIFPHFFAYTHTHRHKSLGALYSGHLSLHRDEQRIRNNGTSKDEWKLSTQVKMEAGGGITSFTEPLRYFHPSTVCPSTLGVRVAINDTNGNGCLWLPPTLLPPLLPPTHLIHRLHLYASTQCLFLCRKKKNLHLPISPSRNPSGGITMISRPSVRGRGVFNRSRERAAAKKGKRVPFFSLIHARKIL